MNISKLIAKFILASFVFSSMQGIILAEGGKTVPNRSNQKIDQVIKNDPVIPGYLFKAPVKPAAPVQNQEALLGENQETPGEETPPGTSGQNPEQPAQEPTLKSPGAIAQTKELLTNLFATIKTDISSLRGQAVNLYNGLLGSVEFTKEGALKMFAKVTPESTLGKAGVIAVIVTGGVVLYYIKVKGIPTPVKIVAGKVADFVTSPKVVKGAAVLGAVGLAAAGLYAYKTGNVRPLANVAYPVVGIPALYAANKLAGSVKNLVVSGASSTKNLVVSGKNAVVSGTKSAASTVGNLIPAPIKSAGSTVASAAKLAGSTIVSGVKKVGSYLPFVGGMITKKAYADFLTVFNKAHSKMSIKVNQLGEKKSELFNLISDEELKKDIQNFFINLQNHKKNKKDVQLINTINALHTKVKAKIEQIIK